MITGYMQFRGNTAMKFPPKGGGPYDLLCANSAAQGLWKPCAQLVCNIDFENMENFLGGGAEFVAKIFVKMTC